MIHMRIRPEKVNSLLEEVMVEQLSQTDCKICSLGFGPGTMALDGIGYIEASDDIQCDIFQSIISIIRSGNVQFYPVK